MTTEQLTLDIPGWGPIVVDPTPAMLRDEQHVFQHSWCGTVIVVPKRPENRPHLGPCPVCDHPDDGWWGQGERALAGDGLAGLREVTR